MPRTCCSAPIPTPVPFHPVDHAQIARACGWQAWRIEDPDDYRPALERALASGEPTLLDVITDLDAHPPITMFEGRLGRS